MGFGIELGNKTGERIGTTGLSGSIEQMAGGFRREREEKKRQMISHRLRDPETTGNEELLKRKRLQQEAMSRLQRGLRGNPQPARA